MRQIRTLMLEIHRLESDPEPNNRSRIQELQQRVTKLSDTHNSNVATWSTSSVRSRRPRFIVHPCNEVDFGIAGMSQTAALLIPPKVSLHPFLK